jgi:DNA-binding CsgD family transcriptional regulator
VEEKRRRPGRRSEKILKNMGISPWTLKTALRM